VSGARGVTKGKVFERKAARALRPAFPLAARCLQYQRAHGAPDVRAGPLWCEVKAWAAPVAPTYRKAAAAMNAAGASLGSVAAVVTPSGRGQPVLITLALADFVRLICEEREGCPF
jgi:hypothetical protein